MAAGICDEKGVPRAGAVPGGHGRVGSLQHRCREATQSQAEALQKLISVPMTVDGCQLP